MKGQGGIFFIGTPNYTQKRKEGAITPSLLVTSAGFKPATS